MLDPDPLLLRGGSDHPVPQLNLFILSSARALADHVAKAHEKRVFTCKKCGKQLSSKGIVLKPCFWERFIVKGIFITFIYLRRRFFFYFDIYSMITKIQI